MPKKVALSFDDFSLINNRFDLLFKLKEHFPKMKVTMFMIPFHAACEFGSSHIFRESGLKTLKDNLDWIQIVPHGLMHMEKEFEKADATATRLALKAIDGVFKKDGIPYVKGFKAPQWLWNQDVVDVLDKEGWFGAIDRNQPGMLKTKKFYTYNYRTNEPFKYSPLDVIKLHGHIGADMDNDLDKSLINLIKNIPVDAEFHYITDFLEDND